MRPSVYYAPTIKYSETLEVLPDPFPRTVRTPQRASIFFAVDDTPIASMDRTHAASDALLAIIRLRAACEAMITGDYALEAAECQAFLEFAKQRLNVVSTAVPVLLKGRK